MARPSYPSDEIDKLLVRFPQGMRDKIKAAADASGRSMNAEIIHRLALTLSYAEGDAQGILHKLDRHEDEIFRQDNEIRELTSRLERSVSLNNELRAASEVFYARMNVFLIAVAEFVDQLPDQLVIFLHDQFAAVAKEQGRIDADLRADQSAEVAAKAIRGMRDNYLHSAATSVRQKFHQSKKPDQAIVEKSTQAAHLGADHADPELLLSLERTLEKQEKALDLMRQNVQIMRAKVKKSESKIA